METKRELLTKLKGKKALFTNNYGGIDIGASHSSDFYHLVADVGEEFIMTETYYQEKLQAKYYYLIDKITSIQKIW